MYDSTRRRRDPRGKQTVRGSFGEKSDTTASLAWRGSLSYWNRIKLSAIFEPNEEAHSTAPWLLIFLVHVLWMDYNVFSACFTPCGGTIMTDRTRFSLSSHEHLCFFHIIMHKQAFSAELKQELACPVKMKRSLWFYLNIMVLCQNVLTQEKWGTAWSAEFQISFFWSLTLLTVHTLVTLSLIPTMHPSELWG